MRVGKNDLPTKVVGRNSRRAVKGHLEAERRVPNEFLEANVQIGKGEENIRPVQILENFVD